MLYWMKQTKLIPLPMAICKNQSDVIFYPCLWDRLSAVWWADGAKGASLKNCNPRNYFIFKRFWRLPVDISCSWIDSELAAVKMRSVTCTAPVNIAVVKYCECIGSTISTNVICWRFIIRCYFHSLSSQETVKVLPWIIPTRSFILGDI